MKIISKKRMAAWCSICMIAVSSIGLMTGCGSKELLFPYETSSFIHEAQISLEASSFSIPPFSQDMCMVPEDYVTPENLNFSSLEAFGLFDLTNKEVVQCKNIKEKLYPASTTKVMTAYLALKYGNLDDVITISSTAMAQPSDASLCHIQEGDQLTLAQLLRGMMMRSGNEAAAAVAEYVAGSQDAFADLMNKEAKAIGAVNSHFVNPHGYHDDNHYTCVYDMYLIFNQAIQYEEFRNIINTTYYSVQYRHEDGSTCTQEWSNTNRYLLGSATPPEGVTVIGGKTGTTSLAGCCLVILSKDLEGNDYISVVFKAADHAVLYEDMSAILKQIPTLGTVYQ